MKITEGKENYNNCHLGIILFDGHGGKVRNYGRYRVKTVREVQKKKVR